MVCIMGKRATKQYATVSWSMSYRSNISQKLTYLSAEKSQGLYKHSILEISIVSRKNDDLINEKVDNSHSKACQRHPDIPEKGRGRENEDIFDWSHVLKQRYQED